MADHRNADVKKDLAAGMPDADKKPVVSLVRDTAPSIDSRHIEMLREAVLSPLPETSRNAVRDLIASGVAPSDIADFYIPAVARLLGDDWCVDQLSFANVTVGSARLQAMLRSLGPNWSGDSAARHGSASILLIVPEDVYHTLGALVLGGQLRRMGFSVKLILGCRNQDIAIRVQRTTYDAVFISSSHGETLESLRRIVDVVKTALSSPPPIVVGGSILDVETKENVTALTGADHATRIPEEAVELCGLQVTTQDDAHLKFRV